MAGPFVVDDDRDTPPPAELAGSLYDVLFHDRTVLKNTVPTQRG